MATSNIKKKLAALSELRKDPVAAIEAAWSAVQADAEAFGQFPDDQAPAASAHDSDIHLIGQFIAAVVEDAKAERTPKPNASDA